MLKFGWGLLAALFLLPGTLQAETFLLTNGDRISGKLVEMGTKFIVIDTPSMGEVSVRREFFKEKEVPKAPPEPKYWSGKINGGYSLQSGNTKTESLTGGLAIKRKVEKVNEFDIQGNAKYGAADKKMNAQKYYGMTRFAYSFGKEKKWYNFYKVEGDHDRFANIAARVTPSTGVGYWFSDTEDWKLMNELGIGVTHTKYRDDTEDKTELVLIPRLYLEKRLFGKSRISEDLTVYPSLTNTGEYRLKSETVFTNPITDKLNFKVTWINEYNSDPGDDVKEHDMSVVSSLEYAF